jgi:hypothetical protein
MTGVRAAVLIVVLAALAACGSGDDAPRAKATSSPSPAPQAVRFRASDGRPVRARYTPAGPDAPAVVLLHEIRGGPEQWAPLIPYLHDAGFATLAYASRPSPVEAERVPDALGAVRWLRRRHQGRIGVVGASIGASTTVLAMATGARRTVDAAVALSPPDSADIWRLQDHGRYRPHDVLFISDRREAVSAEGMLEGAVRSDIAQSAAPGHGVALLAERGVREALLAWLADRVR